MRWRLQELPKLGLLPTPTTLSLQPYKDKGCPKGGCPKNTSDNTYLKILDFAQLFVADATMRKKSKYFTPSKGTFFWDTERNKS